MNIQDMSGKLLFACSKCFSRHPFEDLSTGRQLCKSCRAASSLVRCTYCRAEFPPTSKNQTVCKKCEYNVSKYGKPSACECCKIVAAFSGTKCFRCAGYEAKYGPPVQCEECKQRAAFDKQDENKKVSGKVLCWLCISAYKRAFMKAQMEGRIPPKKRPHEKTQRDGNSMPPKKSARPSTDIPKQSGVMPTGGSVSSDFTSSGNGVPIGNGALNIVSTATPNVVTIDPHSSDHVVVMTNLKEKIASLEKRLQLKDKELLEKDKLLTELKSKNFDKEIEMRNKIKEIERLNEMKVENLNRKVAGLLKEIATLKKGYKKNSKRDNPSPSSEERDKDDKDDDRDEKESIFSSSNSPITN